MKLIETRPYADPDAAATKLFEIAKTLPIDEGRICVGAWNWAFLQAGGNVPEYRAGRDRLIADRLITMHACGGFILPSEAVLADWDGGAKAAVD